MSSPPSELIANVRPSDFTDFVFGNIFPNTSAAKHGYAWRRTVAVVPVRRLRRLSQCPLSRAQGRPQPSHAGPAGRSRFRCVFFFGCVFFFFFFLQTFEQRRKHSQPTGQTATGCGPGLACGLPCADAPHCRELCRDPHFTDGAAEGPRGSAKPARDRGPRGGFVPPRQCLEV